MKLKVGDEAPLFSLPDQDGVMHNLKDYRGRSVVLYFYPKDDTPGCTTEACSFRDNLPDFNKLNIPVFGISVDSVEKHKKFIDKYKLPFSLLSDEDKQVVNLYEVWAQKSFMGKKYQGILRTTFIVNPQGKLSYIYENVHPKGHVEQVLKDLQA